MRIKKTFDDRRVGVNAPDFSRENRFSSKGEISCQAGEWMP
jgi:hypothetical protein